MEIDYFSEFARALGDAVRQYLTAVKLSVSWFRLRLVGSPYMSELTCGGHNMAHGGHNSTRGGHNMADAGHNSTHGGHNKPHAGHKV